MNTLNLGTDDEPVVKKKSNTRNLKIALGLAAVILVPTIGSTLAGAIAINSAVNVEFGQGQAQTTACDDAITVTPTSSFTNASGAGTFKVGTVVLSGIANACTGKIFKVKAWNNTADAGPLILSASGEDSPACVATVTIASGGNTISSQTSNDCVGTVGLYSSEDNTITFTTNTTILSSASVYKFTVETS
jgi:hypothetical protein